MAYPLPAEYRNAHGITDDEGEAAIHYITRNWTRDDLDHLPSGNRYEILDGRLLVTPPASEDHQNWAKWLFRHLDRAAPESWRVQWGIGLDFGPNRCFVPDLLVLSPDTPNASKQYNAIVPALVVEVESPSTAGVDRVDKALAYAKAGIASYWRVERNGRVTVGRLESGEYADSVHEAGEAFTVETPYPVTIPARPSDPR